jgi:hypothetical protein
VQAPLYPQQRGGLRLVHDGYIPQTMFQLAKVAAHQPSIVANMASATLPAYL